MLDWRPCTITPDNGRWVVVQCNLEGVLYYTALVWGRAKYEWFGLEVKWAYLPTD